MSYLHTPRLVFTGDFLSDVSTVNNDTQHYNNATFDPSFQDFGPSGTKGWWNPEGGAIFDFQACTVKQLLDKGGNPVEEDFQGMIITGAEGRATGKMVDLDPDAQQYSQLWAVRLRILDRNGNLMVEGVIDPVGFRDLQQRQTDFTTKMTADGPVASFVNGQPLGAVWTSVLTDLTWGRKAATSPFMQQLRETTQGNRLSINLNALGYYYAHADGRFSLGRILGAIGPWFEGEPDTMIPGRRLYGIYQQPLVARDHTGFTIHKTLFQYTNFSFSPETQRLTLDLGNSFPAADALGTITFRDPLIVAVCRNSCDFSPSRKPQSMDPSAYLVVGEVPYNQGEWLMQTGGIVTFSTLSSEVLGLLENHQLLLLQPQDDGSMAVLARESLEGIYFRADNFVQRLDNGQSNEVNVYAYQWGKLMEGITLSIALQPPGTDTPKDENNPPISITYGNNKPADGLTLSPTTTTYSNGVATLKITGNAIYSPRVYIDGQIYTINYTLDGWNDPAAPNPGLENIVVHLRDAYEIPENPTWDDISYTMQQFANLYPIMSKFLVNLGNPEAVIAKKEILKFAFSQDINSPLYMPVTRDLSEAKRLTILKWLDHPLPGSGHPRTPHPKTRSLEGVASPPSREELLRKQAVAQKQGIDAAIGTDSNATL